MKLIIARHGNTFAEGDTILRVGSRTDIPLVEKGRQQAWALGQALHSYCTHIDLTYCGSLRRLQETAEIVASSCARFSKPEIDSRFNELDYGDDDGIPEEAFLERVSGDEMRLWNEEAIPPARWGIDRDALISMWTAFAREVAEGNVGENILVVTSNGLARFAPYITGDFEGFCSRYPLKLATGAYGVFELDGDAWRAVTWNERPPLEFES